MSTRLIAVIPVFGIALLAGSAFAEQSVYPMDFGACLGALNDTANQLHVPLTLNPNTPDQKAFTLNTTEGSVIMLCDRAAQQLVVTTPSGQSLDPYVSEGYNKAP